jgi:allophanate hydrolase
MSSTRGKATDQIYHHTMGIGDQGTMGRLLVQGQYGHDIINELRPLPGEPVIDKPGKGSFWKTTLHRTLMARGITHLFFCGVTTECCVTTTAREANDRGFECCILTDCTGGFNATSVDVSLNMFCSYDGLFGFIANSNELVAQSRKIMQTPPDSPSTWSGDMSMDALRTHVRGRSMPLQTLVKEVFHRIEKADPLIWTHIRSQEEVMAAANALQAQYAMKSSEELPPLYGIPFAVKDNFDVAGMPTDAVCDAYRYFPEQSALVIKMLIAAGALLIGKTNMDQLATGLNGCRSPLGNPASVYGNGKYISGGSSSGSGVAVAAGLVTFSLGTDTAGSGRVPAALNGIVGYKPTKGTLSARGIVPACKSLDTASIFATKVADARQVWYAIDQYDPEDCYAKPPSSLPLTVSDYRPNPAFTFATPPPSLHAQCSPIYQAAFARTLNTLKSLGGIPLPLTETKYAPFSTASDLLYASTLVHERIASIGPTFIRDNLSSLHPTTRALFSGVLDRPTQPWEVYRDMHTQAAATLAAAQLFDRHGETKVDVLVTPTVPWHPTIKEMEEEPVEANARLGVFTHFGNVLDLCALSVPAGMVEGGEGEEELPFGVQLIGARGEDGRLFDLARRFEKGFESMNE